MNIKEHPAKISIQWKPRPFPLTPCGAVALEAAATRLAQYLLACPQARLDKLRGVAGTALITILGDTADLPWVEGIRYLGQDAQAPGLLLPSNRKPVLPIELLTAAIGRQTTPLTLLDKPPRLIPLDQARPVERTIVQRWLEQH